LILCESKRRGSVIRSETSRRGLDQKNADEDMTGCTAAGWCMLPW
jgi:hypothetical protein